MISARHSRPVARIITIGKNSDLPRVASIRVGVGVDGAAIRAPITLQQNEWVCRFCDGSGEVECGSINPSVKSWWETCPHCDGEGTIIIEHDTAAGSGCLSTAAAGRSGSNDCNPEGPPNSGMKPGSLAAGDLPQFVGRKAHTAQRSVPGLSASRRPAGELPPNALPGTLADRIIDAVTVIAGLLIFGIVALFLMVLA